MIGVHSGMSGTNRLLLRFGILLWVLRAAGEPVRPEEAQRHD